MASGYTTAWAVYLAAVLIAHGLLWCLTRRLSVAGLQQLIHLCVFAIFITPARLEPGRDVWVPAFMAALMEGIDSGMAAASDRLWPILVVMLCLVLASVLLRHYLARRRAAAGGSAANA